MVEPSPPPLHPLSSAGDVGMADVGVKVEQEECGGSRSSPEPTKRSPLHEWSGTHPLEARQLTPPLSRSPSVRFKHFRVIECMSCRNCSCLTGLILVIFLQEGSPGKELPPKHSLTGVKEDKDRLEGQSNFKEGQLGLIRSTI